MRAHIIGIAGPSSSGRRAGEQLARKLPGTSIVSLDSYYAAWKRFRSKSARKSTSTIRLLDWELLHQHFRPSRRAALSTSRSTLSPITPHHQTGASASEFVIVEGLFVLYWPELRAMLDTKVYVSTEAGVCFNRRLTRDVRARPHPESVCEQYQRTVLPSAEWFVYPTMKHADLVVSGDEPLAASTAPF